MDIPFYFSLSLAIVDDSRTTYSPASCNSPWWDCYFPSAQPSTLATTVLTRLTAAVVPNLKVKLVGGVIYYNNLRGTDDGH